MVGFAMLIRKGSVLMKEKALNGIIVYLHVSNCSLSNKKTGLYKDMHTINCGYSQ